MAGKPKSIYLSDHWTIADGLNFGIFMPALLDILQNAETPLTVGVFGAWGSGKTSLLRMLEKHIHDKGQTKFRAVWFTAWKYDKQESLWRAFILRVIDGLYPKENGQRIPLDRLPDPAQKEAVRHLDRLAESLYQTVSWQGEESWSLDLAKNTKEVVKLPLWLALHLARLGDSARILGLDPDVRENRTQVGAI